MKDKKAEPSDLIPVSIVDNKLKELLDNEWDEVMDYTIFASRSQSAIKALAEIKKESIPAVPLQYIKDRIKQLKENLKTAEGAETFDIDSRIDELEDLILE